MPPLTDITGVYASTRWRAKDSDYQIGYLEADTCVCGSVPEGELITGCPYQFFGSWVEHVTHGKQFRFSQVLKKEPHSQHGVIAYLVRYATHVGPQVAQALFDQFGSDAVKMLRTQPEAAANVSRYLNLMQATEASEALKQLEKLEDTKIELTNLFAGRGFPMALVDDCVTAWGILAPTRIKRDPHSLLVNEFSGCGFDRCDRLYVDLGLPIDRLKRQVIWREF